jgi:hypothetical protein
MRLRQEDLEWLVLPVFGGRKAAGPDPPERFATSREIGEAHQDPQ